MKAVIYTRVSTDDQKENGFSLQEQEARLRKYCAQQAIEIIHHYQDDHSAKNFNRPAFQQFLTALKAKTLKPDLFLCVRPDRFSRNMMESLSMIQQLTSYGVKFQTLENHTDLNSPEALIPFMLNMLLPQVDNERRSLNTIAGMRQAAREGRWVWRAPIGYKNDSIYKSIVINEAVAPLVIEAFELYAKGIYAVEEVRLFMREKGLVCSKNNFLNMLENPFYTGKFKLDAWKDQPEEIIQGKHEPLISEELFEVVQEVRFGKKRQQVSISATRRKELELRGFLQCRCCGIKLTGSASRSRNGQRHFYYHCQHGCKERFRADEANQHFIDFLRQLTPANEVLELYHRILKDTFGADSAKKESEIKKVLIQIEHLENRLSVLTDRLVDGVIEKDVYVQKRAAYKAELSVLSDSLKVLEMQEDSFAKYLSFGCTLLGNLSQYYQQSSLAIRQKIVGSIFPGKLIYEEEKYRTTEMNYFVELICSESRQIAGKEEGQTMLLHNLPSWAPEAGLEPATL